MFGIFGMVTASLDGLSNGKSLLVTGEGAGGVAQIGGVGVALDVANFFIGSGQFFLQGNVVAFIAGEAIEIMEGAIDEKLASFGGAGKIFDGCLLYTSRCV